jgi:D-arabinose 5-phosphate isomerase GutQ
MLRIEPKDIIYIFSTSGECFTVFSILTILAVLLKIKTTIP